MKNTSDSHAWVPIAVGVAGLLALGIAFRQCGSSPSAESFSEPKLAAKAQPATTERGGWIAQSQPRANGAATDRGRPGAANARIADSAPPSRTGRDSDAEEFAPPRGSGIRDTGERDFRDTDTVDVGGDAIAAQPHLPPANVAGAAGMREAAGAAGTGEAAGGSLSTGTSPAAAAPGQAVRPSTGKTDSPETQPVVEAKGAAQPDGLDNSGPVLSLPLDNSVEPDKGGDTTPIIATGVTFDQNGAHFADNAQLVIPGDTVNAAAGTVTFWIKPDWAGDVDHKYQILHLGAMRTWENRLDIFKDLAYLRLLMCPDSGFESGSGANITAWRKGDSHMITGTWGDGVVDMYIDGVSVGPREYQGELDFGPSPPFMLGSGTSGGDKEGANSNITGFALYTRALGPDEVAALYAQPPP